MFDPHHIAKTRCGVYYRHCAGVVKHHAVCGVRDGKLLLAGGWCGIKADPERVMLDYDPVKAGVRR